LEIVECILLLHQRYRPLHLCNTIIRSQASQGAIHHAYDPVDHHGAVSPPVYFTSTYAFESVAEHDEAAAQGGKLYAREHNPTTEILEKRLANLEGD
jgi:O-acetylhomoserine/O-acetylserine sulfhydrylase-like pyridoxal-dependent enzyme